MRVLIVDDHPLFRAGIKALLTGLDPALTTLDAGSLNEAADAVAAAGNPPLDLVLLDMNLPGVSGIEAIRQARVLFENAAVVVVSALDDPRLIASAIDAGASGYIAKTTDAALTIQALRLVLANGVYLPVEALGAQPASGARGTAMPQLSARQHDVLRGLLQGKSNKVIARELDIAEGTVKAHLWAVYQALGVNSRTQAMYRVHELGLFGS